MEFPQIIKKGEFMYSNIGLANFELSNFLTVGFSALDKTGIR
jgi:hypothetical protein